MLYKIVINMEKEAFVIYVSIKCFFVSTLKSSYMRTHAYSGACMHYCVFFPVPIFVLLFDLCYANQAQ